MYINVVEHSNTDWQHTSHHALDAETTWVKMLLENTTTRDIYSSSPPIRQFDGRTTPQNVIPNPKSFIGRKVRA